MGEIRRHISRSQLVGTIQPAFPIEQKDYIYEGPRMEKRYTVMKISGFQFMDFKSPGTARIRYLKKYLKKVWK